jgi:hypothetical protein
VTSRRFAFTMREYNTGGMEVPPMAEPIVLEIFTDYV